MKTLNFLIIVFLIINLVADDEKKKAVWVSMGYLPGTDGSVRDLYLDGDFLYLGGNFSIVKNKEAKNIARLHIPTKNWSTLGDGFEDSVQIITGDKSGNIYVGGYHGTEYENYRIAKWNGSEWKNIGETVDGFIKVLKTDSSGNLYAAGSFSEISGFKTGNFAKWDGEKWSAFATGLKGSIYSMQFVSPENIYASVNLENTDPVTSKVAIWNGEKWTDLGKTFEGTVYALGFDENGFVYAGGSFSFAGEPEAYNFAIWKNSEWISTGAIFEGTIYEILVIDPENVFIGGGLYKINDITVKGMAKWDGNEWTGMSKGSNITSSSIYSFALYKDNDFYVGGSFSQAGDIAASNIAKWNGSEMVPLEYGLNRQVTDIEVDKDGDIIIAGRFYGVGKEKANHIAKWNGVGWDSFGRGTDGSINSIDIDKDGNIAAGGDFNKADGKEAKKIALWNGSEWKSLGSWLGSSVKSVSADSFGGIYAGGSYGEVERWNGNEWKALGTGLGGFWGLVDSTDVDSSHNFYIAGSFMSSGDVSARDVAKWDNQKEEWVLMNERNFNEYRYPNMASQVAVNSKNIPVFITGYQLPWPPEFQDSWMELEKYENNEWTTLGINPVTFTITAKDEIFMISYTRDDQKQINGYKLSKFNGMGWQEYDIEIDRDIRVIKYIEKDDTLLVGGNFITVGGKVSPYLAKICFSDECIDAEGETVVENDDDDDDDQTMEDKDQIPDFETDDESFSPDIGYEQNTDNDVKDNEFKNITGCNCTIVF